MGQGTCPHCYCCHEKICRPQRPASPASCYSPDFALADFFLFYRVKEVLVNLPGQGQPQRGLDRGHQDIHR